MENKLDVVKLRIHEQTVNISVPKCKTFDDMRKRGLTINKYKRFLTKIFKK